MRNRTRNSFSYGSMWMSLAPFWIADISIRLTRRMTGASPPCFSSDDTSIWSSSSSTSTSSSTTDALSSSALVTISRVAALFRLAEAAAGFLLGFLFRLLLGDARRGRGGVVADDRIADRGLGGDHRLDVVARHELDVVHGEHVGRVGHRDGEGRAGPAERNDLVLVGGFGRDQLDDPGVDLELGQVDRGNAVLLAEERGDLFVLDEAELDEIEAQLAAVRLLIGQRILQLGRSDALLFEQQLTDANGHVGAFSLREDQRTDVGAAVASGQNFVLGEADIFSSLDTFCQAQATVLGEKLQKRYCRGLASEHHPAGYPPAS